MHRKHRRHKRAPPPRAGHVPQHQKQEDHRRRVQQNIRQMMAAGIEDAVELAVQHMRQHRQRMPVRRDAVRENPAEATPAQSMNNPGIFIDVFVVIVVDKLKMQRLPEDNPHRRRQKHADPKNGPTRA